MPTTIASIEESTFFTKLLASWEAAKTSIDDTEKEEAGLHAADRRKSLMKLCLLNIRMWDIKEK